MRRAQQLGRYHLLDRIAFGGMAEIYRAKTFDTAGQPHLVAVKRVLAHLAEDDDFIQMLVDEAKIASILRHNSIARVYEFARAHGEYFIAMEHVDGKDMRTILERCRQKKKPVPPEHAAYVAAEICGALHAAHSAVDGKRRPLRIVHRDVSPSNVICSYAGEVKLCDFGIAKATLSKVQTKTGVIKGKVKYMSPEQALGRKLDHRSDVFSLGSCLYEMLTRIPPFTASHEMDLLIKVRDAKYRPVSDLVPTVPPELEAICDKCLTRSRAQRYQTAAEVEHDLRAFLRKYMPNYSRSHLGRFVRKMFATEIEKELRMLEEYVLSEQVSDDVGENLIRPDADYQPDDVPFQPRPTGSHFAAPASGSEFTGSSNITTAPQAQGRGFDIHGAETMILHSHDRRLRRPSPPAPTPAASGPASGAATAPRRAPTAAPARTGPAVVARPRPPTAPPPTPDFDEELHGAPTMIIDMARIRRTR
ncbi:MAG: serine/threonine protein kinase [Kofleriaceae bacterium]|nr:serine/threonine protein kinase [Kofleriaceae bacterium]MBP9206085.1 serine/threonine protein kinase [Kofleriaceae bacterium]